MKYWLLKFCYGVEIGAYWAYRGHHKVTNDKEVLRIAHEELSHMVLIKRVLSKTNHKPFWGFNLLFFLIGKTVYGLCFISPVIALNLVAGFLEKLNVISYTTMAKLFPEDKLLFQAMQENEQEHEVYFLQKTPGASKIKSSI